METAIAERIDVTTAQRVAKSIFEKVVTSPKSTIEEVQEMVTRGILRRFDVDFLPGPFGHRIAKAQRHDGRWVPIPLDDPREPLSETSRALLLGKDPIPDKPSTDILRKMETPELVPGDGRQALAVQVEDLLGYTPLRKDAGAPSRLQRVLQELEITAFDQATVDEYKRKMRRHFQAKLDASEDRFPKEMSPEQRFLSDMRAAADAWFIPTISGRRPVERRAVWDEVELSDYAKPVPEFVLRKCLQIKQAAPDAQFFVDELREEQRTLDPFLVVMIGDDRAAIEVWDEPEFEKAL